MRRPRCRGAVRTAGTRVVRKARAYHCSTRWAPWSDGRRDRACRGCAGAPRPSTAANDSSSRRALDSSSAPRIASARARVSETDASACCRTSCAYVSLASIDRIQQALARRLSRAQYPSAASLYQVAEEVRRSGHLFGTARNSRPAAARSSRGNRRGGTGW